MAFFKKCNFFKEFFTKSMIQALNQVLKPQGDTNFIG
jgi:hypothetical protein